MDNASISNPFNAYYHQNDCGTNNYERNDIWMNFFDGVAKTIIEKINPASVLDAGCGLGFLVENLRKYNVETYGIDISQDAIQHVEDTIKSFCWQGSIVDPFPQKYGLITCIEVLEHLPKADLEKTIKNLCAHSDDILLSSRPFDYTESIPFNVQPREYWVEQFALNGFYPDLDFDASFLTPWAIRFVRKKMLPFEVAGYYERKYWPVWKENQDLRNNVVHLQEKLSQSQNPDADVESLSSQLASLQQNQVSLQIALIETRAALSVIQSSGSYRILQKTIALWDRTFPIGSKRQRMGNFIKSLLKLFFRIRKPAMFRHQIGSLNSSISSNLVIESRLAIPSVEQPRENDERNESIDIIVCVHNALEDVRRCLTSIEETASQPCKLILVNDGSNAETSQHLDDYTKAHPGTILIVNTEARGYTRAANQGLKQSNAPFMLLLNSDTIVTPGWLDKLYAAMQSNPKNGVVGPLSNTASWQSIPRVMENDDWSTNPLPAGVSINEMAAWIEQSSARAYPEMPLLNGFCMMIRRKLIDAIGYLDEETFAQGYGEEDDFNLRARKAGWRLALADDVFIYHAQSRSFTNERRKLLSQESGKKLAAKHTNSLVVQSCQEAIGSRVLEGIRKHSAVLIERNQLIEKGKGLFGGKRILFVLPIGVPGGGANVVFDDAKSMIDMGVDVRVFNLNSNRDSFLRSYPDLKVPVTYGEIHQIASLSRLYDAVVGTVNFSIEWLADLHKKDPSKILGYYVQGFEPLIYERRTYEYKRALKSYTLFPNLICFTKTDWTRRTVWENTKKDCKNVGISLNTDLFRPRPRIHPSSQNMVRVSAMIRPSTPYREPKLTMEVLRRIQNEYSGRVETWLYGTEPSESGFSELPTDFDWKLAGTLTQRQVARFFNEVDVFVDFSSHQAMGLSTLESMACGCSVIVPANGGSKEFIRNDENGLIVDTSTAENCYRSLKTLIESQELRMHTQQNALETAHGFYTENSAYRILETLFGL